MPVTVPPLAHPQYPRNPGKPEGGGGLALTIIIAVVLFVAVGLVVRDVLHADRARTEQRHEYHGVTWLGDECRVLDGGVLICLVRPEA